MLTREMLIEALVAQRDRDNSPWVEVFEDGDACLDGWFNLDDMAAALNKALETARE